jgi:hypothetical protein
MGHQFVWSTDNPNAQEVRTEGGETVEVFPESGGAVAGNAGNFVWADPSSVQSGNVYNNWPDLAAAIAAVRGQKTVTIVFANPTITPGAWPDITDVTFLGGESTPVAPVLTIADGATLTVVHKLTFDAMVVTFAGTTVPCISLSGTQILECNLQNAAQIGASGSKPFVSLAGSSSLVTFLRTSQWAAGTIAVTSLGAVVDMFLFDGSSLAAGTLSATALGTVAIAIDGASQPGLPSNAVGTITPAIQLLDPQPTFVFRPGATGLLPGNVFTTWATLAGALALTAGERSVLVDDTLAAAHMTAGTWDVDNVTFTTIWNSTATLIIDAGAKFAAGTSRVVFKDGITVTSNAASPGELFTVPASGFFMLVLDNNVQWDNTTASAPFSVPVTAELNLFVDRGCSFGEGTHPVVTVAGTLSAQFFNFSGISANSVAGAGTKVISFDSSSTDNSGGTPFLLDNAIRVAYTPNVPGNWSGAAPTTVQQALDRIAANTTNAHPIP